MHIYVHCSDPICLHVYLRLAQYSLLALLVTTLSSHTSHLFFETENVSLCIPIPARLRTDEPFYPSVCTCGEIHSLTLCWCCGMLAAFQTVGKAVYVLC